MFVIASAHFIATRRGERKVEQFAQCALLPAVEGHVSSDTEEQESMILAGVTSKEHAFSLKSIIVCRY